MTLPKKKGEKEKGIYQMKLYYLLRWALSLSLSLPLFAVSIFFLDWSNTNSSSLSLALWQIMSRPRPRRTVLPPAQEVWSYEFPFSLLLFFLVVFNRLRERYAACGDRYWFVFHRSFNAFINVWLAN